MRNQALITAVAVAAALAAGCGSASGQRAASPGGGSPAAGAAVVTGTAAREPAADPRPYGAADTAFGLDVLGAWCRRDPLANIVLSPASLATGLGLAYLGARGSTARVMARVLHVPAAGAALEAGLHARSAALRALESPGVTLAEGDQLWADPTLTTSRGYLNAIATGYGAGLRHAPLLSDPGQAAAQINGEISAVTRGHIPALVTPADLDGAGWVLTDALYLDADWATPFQAAKTRPATFTTAAGQQVSAPFLRGGAFSSASAGGWTAVSLPYRGGKLAMVALLPDSGSGGCPALSAPVLDNLTAVLAGQGGGGPASPGQAAVAQTDIALPKVSLSSRASLEPLLTGLGMGAAFGPRADFSRLSPQACCIGLVMHAATLRVAEKGTVASAATAVGIMPTAIQAPLRSIVFDRPYLLVVTDTATGEPLFLARVASPV
jgi:serine protease inhibitor